MFNEEIDKMIDEMDITKDAPVEEPMRQYYFIKKARSLVRQRSEKLGRPLFCCTRTFGCPIV